MLVRSADVKLEVIGVKKLDPVLSALRKWHAMPYLFPRTVRARIALACPTGDLELSPAWCQAWIVQTIFDFIHRFPEHQFRAELKPPDGIEVPSTAAALRSHSKGH